MALAMMGQGKKISTLTSRSAGIHHRAGRGRALAQLRLGRRAGEAIPGQPEHAVSAGISGEFIVDVVLTTQ